MSYILFETKGKLSWTNLINKFSFEDEQKVINGWNIFLTICARNVSIIFVTTSCECEEVTFHCR